MTTPTETAILAVVAALQAKAQEPAATIPLPLRNEDLVARLVEIGDGLARHLNVLDGDRADGEELLGADLGNADGYDIEWRVRIEWAVAGGASAAREAAFDAGRKAIWDALKPDISGGAPVYLGGAVNGVRLVEILAHERTVAGGLPNVKACEFVFALTYTSPDPF